MDPQRSPRGLLRALRVTHREVERRERGEVARDEGMVRPEAGLHDGEGALAELDAAGVVACGVETTDERVDLLGLRHDVGLRLR